MTSAATFASVSAARTGSGHAWARGNNVNNNASPPQAGD